MKTRAAAVSNATVPSVPPWLTASASMDTQTAIKPFAAYL
jgi:hypothetical protein